MKACAREFFNTLGGLWDWCAPVPELFGPLLSGRNEGLKDQKLRSSPSYLKTYIEAVQAYKILCLPGDLISAHSFSPIHTTV
jgi:hypothetical protein